MPGPERGLEKTTASPRMIADCAVDKFLWHMPVHRQEAYLKLHGVDLSRSIMNGWILRGAMVCEPLWRALCKANRAQMVKQCDETPVCVVKGEESKDRFLWCVLSTLAITFDITETRNQRIAAMVLGEIGEATMTDGHGCYSKKSIPGVHSNCLAHARRKFYDALLSFPKDRLYNLDPTAYLADVMTKITAGFPAKRIDELLPWNWQSTAAPPSTPPLISRDEDLPVAQLIELRRLAGKVRVTRSVGQAQAASQSS